MSPRGTRVHFAYTGEKDHHPCCVYRRTSAPQWGTRLSELTCKRCLRTLERMVGLYNALRCADLDAGTAEPLASMLSRQRREQDSRDAVKALRTKRPRVRRPR